jgi:ribosome-binding factor A
MTTQRQLKVGETLKKILSNAFSIDKIHEHFLGDVFITVSEVKISPDLKNATVYVLPASGVMMNSEDKESCIKFLNEFLREISNYVARNTTLKFLPKLFFKYDDSYEQAEKIATLLKETEES